MFRFTDVAAKLRSWWLVLSAEGVDVCDFDPGHDIAVSITGKPAEAGGDLARRPALVRRPAQR